MKDKETNEIINTTKDSLGREYKFKLWDLQVQ